MNRTVEIFTGAYAGGKSEISINRALMLKNEETNVTLVDLDTVEPAYTLRPLKKELDALGIEVVTQESYFGLGETGNVITPAQQNCLKRNQNNIVIDVGYGAGGLDILNLITGIEDEPNLNIFIVINASKPETSSVENIVDYVKWSIGSDKNPPEWKKFNGIISNTHFSDETEPEDVLNGLEKTKKAAEILKLPIRAITVSEKLYPKLESVIYSGVPVWQLKRFMPRAMW